MKKIAVIQFGAAKDVTAAYQKMVNVKKQHDEVLEIDILNLTQADEKFLYNERLYQIIVVGHSSSWDEKNYFISHKNRMIGSISLFDACEIMMKLAKETTATKFNFYPCEIADKLQDNIELRDLKVPYGLLQQPYQDPLQFFEQLNNRLNKEDVCVSSLDLLTQAILQGKAKRHEKNVYLSISVGGQVGPGDPEIADDPGSPRKSISRELVREMFSKDMIKKDHALKAIDRADHLYRKQLKQDNCCNAVWVENKFNFFLAGTTFQYSEICDETPDGDDKNMNYDPALSTVSKH